MKIGVKQWYPWAIRGENCVFVRPLVENTSVRRTDGQTDRRTGLPMLPLRM